MITHILIIFTILSFVTSQELNMEEFARKAYLDADQSFQIQWNFNKTHIVFEMRVRSSGWIGIGFSANGNMINADIHVGWVKDGEVFIKDHHGESFNTFPPLDTEQNLALIRGSECNGETAIVFVRQLVGCQSDQDYTLSSDTLKVIYAFGDEDPAGDDITFSDYHGTKNRGALSLLLFEEVALPITDEDALSFELRMSDEPLPQQPTLYRCQIFELPQLDKKHHIIRIEPVLNEEFGAHVHHFTAFECTEAVNPDYIGKHAECFGGKGEMFNGCESKMIAAWDFGGQPTYFPDNVGLPIGESNERKFVSLQTHYNNPDEIEIRDNSGLRFVYTPNLRQYDAGIMRLGHIVPGPLFVVPPRLESFEVEGGCDAFCLKGMMKAAGVDEIYITNVLLHSHNAGRKLKFRHIRNGIELPFIAKDDSYDFNYQRDRAVTPERTVKAGDDLLMSCEYSSLDRNQPIVGGLGTKAEMCISFFIYYPRIPLDLCSSAPDRTLTILDRTLAIEKTKSPKRTSEMSKIDTRNIGDFIVQKPKKKADRTVADVTSEFPWDYESGKLFEKKLKGTTQLQWCLGSAEIVKDVRLRMPIQITQEYVEPTMNCEEPSSGFFTEVNATSCTSNE